MQIDKYSRPQYIYIYIYIYITNLISTSIHGTRKYTKKTPPGTRDKSISIHCPGEKRKNYRSKKKKRPTSSDLLKKKNQGIRSQLVKGKLKIFRESCNATITKVLNTSGAKYKVNFIYIYIYIYIYTFSNTEARAPTSAGRSPFLPARRAMRFVYVV